MSTTDTTSSQCDVEVMNAPLDPTVYGCLVAAEVASSLFVPSQFRLVFREMPANVLEPGGLQLATPVSISVNAGGTTTALINGEVTAVEVDYAPDGAFTVVRGMDKSHRLMRGTKTVAYPQMTASEVVTQLLDDAGLGPGTVSSTTNVHEWLTQANVSDWVFIQQLGALENYVAYVGSAGSFYFGPMADPTSAPPPVLTYSQVPHGAQLVKGANLVRLRATVTSAEQVPTVSVTGYDPSMAAPVVGVSPALPSTSQSTDPRTLPAEVAGELGATPFFDAGRPFDNEATAANRAASIAADIAGGLAELEGECLGNASVLAGQTISIGMAGMPFDGQYVVSAARHVFEPESGGYTTWFTVGGFRDRSMLALAGGGFAPGPAGPSVGGLVIGVVSDNSDDQQQGRVKVTFPWLSDSYVSAWARTVQIGASKAGSGFLWLPEVGDEVLVGFDRGDIDHPYVLGNLYNGVVLPQPAPSIDSVVSNRRIASRARHVVQFDDGPDVSAITIQTGSQTCTVKMDDQQQSITVTAQGQVVVQSGSNGMSISSDGDITISAGGSLSLQGANVSVSSNGSLGLQGSDVSVSGDGSVSVSGPSISLGA
jgi:uncharacterized protein involved in type VI secretion and phage assembly